MDTVEEFKNLPKRGEGWMWVSYREPLRYGSRFMGWQERRESSCGVPMVAEDEMYIAGDVPTVYLRSEEDD